jgi:hypothetical protein
MAQNKVTDLCEHCDEHLACKECVGIFDRERGLDPEEDSAKGKGKGHPRTGHEGPEAE